MKETEGWVKIKKYTDDDGKPVCNGETECRLWLQCGLMDTTVFGDIPGQSCPVWHGESKSDIAALIEEIANNKETVMAAGPEPQSDADEPRYSVHITGPERLLSRFVDAVWLAPQEK